MNLYCAEDKFAEEISPYVNIANIIINCFSSPAKPNLMRPTSEIQLYKKDLFLQCSPLKDVNRKGMTFSWAYCDIDKVSKKGSTSTCEKEENWKDLQSSSGNALEIQSNQKAGIRLYRCRSKNDIGSDEIMWKIVIPLGK